MRRTLIRRGGQRMKELEDRKRFIELRATCKSLTKIAKEIGVSRQTLANWERAHEEEIGSLHAMELDALEEDYWMKRLGHIELIGTSLRHVKEELEQRDLSDVPTAKLFELELKLIAELKQLFSRAPVMSEMEVEDRMRLRDSIEFPATPYMPDPPRRIPLSMWEWIDDDDDSEDGGGNANSN